MSKQIHFLALLIICLVTRSQYASGCTTPPVVHSITGSDSMCVSSLINLTEITPGGTWSTSNSHLTVTSFGPYGAIIGISAGIDTVSYSVTDTCGTTTVTKIITVLPHPFSTISGPTIACVGSVLSFTDTTASGGIWSSSDTTDFISGGVLDASTIGIDTIKYTVDFGICGGTNSASIVVSIESAVAAGSIGGYDVINPGETETLTNIATGGTWSSSNSAIASIDPASGAVTGIDTGNVAITYTVNTCTGISTATFDLSVTPVNEISGTVFFGSTPYTGNVKVWLITYDTATYDLEAIDSVIVPVSGTGAYYSFTGMGTDSFRIKAAVSNDSTYSSTGYVPTYHTSSFSWDTANVLFHTVGNNDSGQNINMAYGTITSGPGFIAGDVTMGADKGTSSAVPVKGLLVLAISQNTNTLVQQTYTNAAGAYSFKHLPPGKYIIHPEEVNYTTTSYADITLITDNDSMTSANFVEHTLSHTISPATTGIKNVPVSTSYVVTYPSPTSGKLNIQWNETQHEQGTVIITDITGREIYKASLDMTSGSGNSSIDLSGYVNGIYMIAIKSNNINYNNKVVVQH